MSLTQVRRGDCLHTMLSFPWSSAEKMDKWMDNSDSPATTCRG
jgi:hypothetical protein